MCELLVRYSDESTCAKMIHAQAKKGLKGAVYNNMLCYTDQNPTPGCIRATRGNEKI